MYSKVTMVHKDTGKQLVFTILYPRSRVDSSFVEIRDEKNAYQDVCIMMLFDVTWQGKCFNFSKSKHIQCTFMHS